MNSQLLRGHQIVHVVFMNSMLLPYRVLVMLLLLVIVCPALTDLLLRYNTVVQNGYIQCSVSYFECQLPMNPANMCS